MLDDLTYELDASQFPEMSVRKNPSRLLQYMEAYADRLYQNKKAEFTSEHQLQEYTRLCILNALDAGWVEEVDYLQQLQYASSTRGTAQRNPVFEYSREAFASFENMQSTMKRNMARNFFLGDPQIGSDGEMRIVFP